MIRTAFLCVILFFALFITAGCESKDEAKQTATEPTSSTTPLTDEQVDDLVRRSYQYLAMYNVNNKFAMKQGEWNTCVADTQLKDHTMTDIARPNNDTLYISCLLDLRTDGQVLSMPAFDSKYVSLMITGYDHYVNIPLSTRLGDFSKPEKMVIYSARTEGYQGKPVKSVDRTFEASGDFVSAVFRVMPHANDKARFKRISDQMGSVKLMSLSEYLGGKAKPSADTSFPQVGKTDADIFGNNLLEVMQFVFNHTTFDPKNELDQSLLALYQPLGVAPGRTFDPAKVVKLDGARLKAATERIASAQLAIVTSPSFMDKMLGLFKPKGQMTLELLFSQSVLGPIGMPAAEAFYPPISTADGKPMNAMNSYVIRMAKKDLPPAKAFWSVTLYDVQNGFFIPNDQKKYSVGENAGMKLDKDGGIAIYIAAEKPKGVPAENWLPINRKDEAIGAIMRIYVPDLEKVKSWKAPMAELIK